MSDQPFKLTHPPIIEAVLDIECDLPPDQDLVALDAVAREGFRSDYPKHKTQFYRHFNFDPTADEQPAPSEKQVQAFLYLSEDEKQLVQLRSQGFSFNRLAPYEGFDGYLPEIERVWNLYVDLASPLQIREVKLRYINRFVLPVGAEGGVNIDVYLALGPRLPDEATMTFIGFTDQQQAIETQTGHIASTILTTQPFEEGGLPLILDITVSHAGNLEPNNWESLVQRIDSLRQLKNRIFRNTLTEECLSLFQ